MEIGSYDLTNNLSIVGSLDIETKLKEAVRITRNFIFPLVCSIAVISCLVIEFTIFKTGVKRASRLYIILLASTDIIQSLGLIG